MQQHLGTGLALEVLVVHDIGRPCSSRRVRLPRSFSTSGAAGSVADDDGASATVVVVVELAPVASCVAMDPWWAQLASELDSHIRRAPAPHAADSGLSSSSFETMADGESANVQVAVRVRPMNERELRGNTLPVVTALSTSKEVTLIKGSKERQSRQTFNFDHVRARRHARHLRQPPASAAANCAPALGIAPPARSGRSTARRSSPRSPTRRTCSPTCGR